ncbi:hypothetical protein SAMN05216266_104125 [Amycolatopsis marina]|uniref:Uncharacterized protein n=1 Tax=Amycolatopsis marina TaxID=490629 RepID=A0A1I0Y036_9PSEU|nr:hypothetical protein [Amycolatopsis marina]SFB06247.1 hypothetical protein SAMN05216266_104125 [Amycolatopsis marina]
MTGIRQWYLTTSVAVATATGVAIISIAFSPALALVLLLTVVGTLLVFAAVTALRGGERSLKRILREELDRR